MEGQWRIKTTVTIEGLNLTIVKPFHGSYEPLCEMYKQDIPPPPRPSNSLNKEDINDLGIHHMVQRPYMYIVHTCAKHFPI
jgi:hypothetical protein